MKLYLIAGSSGTGKDELGKIMKEQLEKDNTRVTLLKITKPLYNLCKDHFGWNGDMNNKPRELLQTLGIEVIRKQLHKDDYLLNHLIEDIEILNLYFEVGIVTDIRLTEELEVLSDKFNTTTIKISRENYQSTLTEPQQSHLTENDYENYTNYDFEIVNTNIDKLTKDALVILGGSKNE